MQGHPPPPPFLCCSCVVVVAAAAIGRHNRAPSENEERREMGRGDGCCIRRGLLRRTMCERAKPFSTKDSPKVLQKMLFFESFSMVAKSKTFCQIFLHLSNLCIIRRVVYM